MLGTNSLGLAYPTVVVEVATTQRLGDFIRHGHETSRDKTGPRSRDVSWSSRRVPGRPETLQLRSRDNTKVPGLFVHYSAMHKHGSVNYLNRAMISESLTL